MYNVYFYFIFQIIPHFYPPLMEKVKNGVYSSLRQILEKRVLPSLCPIFDSDKLDKELRASVREHFLEFCFPPPVEGMFMASYTLEFAV